MKNFKETFLLFRSQEHIWLAVKGEVMACGQESPLPICPLRKARKGAQKMARGENCKAGREVKGKEKKEGKERL